MRSFRMAKREKAFLRSFRLIRIYEKREIGFIYVDRVSARSRAGLFPGTWLSRNLSRGLFPRGSRKGGFCAIYFSKSARQIGFLNRDYDERDKLISYYDYTG